MSWTCKIGLHTLVRIHDEFVIHPPLGPYDPRTDEQRTDKTAMTICAQCGKKSEYYPDYDI